MDTLFCADPISQANAERCRLANEQVPFSGFYSSPITQVNPTRFNWCGLPQATPHSYGLPTYAAGPYCCGTTPNICFGLNPYSAQQNQYNPYLQAAAQLPCCHVCGHTCGYQNYGGQGCGWQGCQSPQYIATPFGVVARY